jgi:hypothetical protein
MGQHKISCKSSRSSFIRGVRIYLNSFTQLYSLDGVVMEVEESESMKKIGGVETTEKGKPYRTGFLYEMSETTHRGHYTCELHRDGESNQDVGSSGTTSGAFASYTYYVRVKGNFTFSVDFILCVISRVTSQKL